MFHHFLDNRAIVRLQTLWLFLMLFFLPIAIMGKNQLSFECKGDFSKQNKFISSVVKILNNDTIAFSGNVELIMPEHIRSLVVYPLEINVPAKDSIFIPMRFIPLKDVVAGDKEIQFILYNQKQEELKRCVAILQVEEKISLAMQIENRNIFITNPNDSVRIQTLVSNNGNTEEDVTVVFNIPMLNKGTNFIEYKARISPGQQHSFTFNFLAHPSLLEHKEFNVSVAAFRGSEMSKELFANGSAVCQYIANNRHYAKIHTDLAFYQQQNNTLSLSHRRTLSSIGTTQLMGKGNLDLAAGYLSAAGTIYNYGFSSNIVGTNTYLSYHLKDNIFTIGNIYETSDVVLSGRGVKMELGNGTKASVRMGIIDQNYNIFSSLPLLSNTFSVYSLGSYQIGVFEKLGTSLIYQYDDLERTNNIIAGGEITYKHYKQWHVKAKLSTAVSHATELDLTKPSALAEVNYFGRNDKFDWSGNYFYSSPYFPGYRRGMLYLNQSFSQKLNSGHSFRTSGYYSGYKPRSMTLSNYPESYHSNVDFTWYFPAVKNLYTSLAYLNRYEGSTSYTQTDALVSLYANQIKSNFRWNKPGISHTFGISLEGGAVKYPIQNNFTGQFRSGLNYSYNWININASYQYGSFYLSDYFQSQRFNKTFRRYLLTMSVNRSFLENKLILNAGGNINSDLTTKFTPSAFLNARYRHTKSFSLFTNASWVNYRFILAPPQHTLNIEAGLTWSFPDRKVSSGLKSKLTAYLFLDHNQDGQFGTNEIPAKDFKVVMDKTAFITNEQGEITYKHVPFGKYKISRISERGWFSSIDSIEVNKFNTKIAIPLRQAGSVTGKINYIFDARLSVEVKAQRGGVAFVITNDAGTLTQRVVADDDGSIAAFLPAGNYTVELQTKTLHADMACKNPIQNFEITAGKITKLKPFDVEIRKKNINIKQF